MHLQSHFLIVGEHVAIAVGPLFHALGHEGRELCLGTLLRVGDAYAFRKDEVEPALTTFALDGVVHGEEDLRLLFEQLIP